MKRNLISLLLALALLMTSVTAFAANIPMELPLVDPGSESLTVLIWENYYTGNSYADILPTFQEIEKATGVKAVLTPVVDDAKNKEALKTRLAAGIDLPDITVIPENDVARYASAGIIIPLDELLDKYAPNIKQEFFVDLPAIGGGMTSPDGHVYAIANNFYGGNLIDMPGILVRQDWLDKLGLDKPQTLDDWYNMLKAFKEQDPNGNGIQDEIPFAAAQVTPLSEYGYLGTAFGLTANFYDAAQFKWTVDENNQVVNQYKLPGFKDFLAFLNKLYTEGLIQQSWGSNNNETINAYVAQNIVGVCINWQARARTYEQTLELGGFPGAQIEQILPPVDENGNRKISKRQAIGQYVAITKDCKNPELAMRWLDYVMGYDEGINFLSYGVEGLSFTWENGQRVWTDLIAHNPEGLNQSYALRSVGAFCNTLLNRKVEFYEMMIEPRYVVMAKELWPYLVQEFPSLIASEDESDEISLIESSLLAYEDEMIYKFVSGKESLDKFDKFLQTCDDMGSERLREIKQQQVDRVFGK